MLNTDSLIKLMHVAASMRDTRAVFPYTNKSLQSTQWRTQKFFMGGFIQWHMVVIFHGRVSFSAIWWSFVLVCVVCDVTIWRHIHVSKQPFG